MLELDSPRCSWAQGPGSVCLSMPKGVHGREEAKWKMAVVLCQPPLWQNETGSLCGMCHSSGCEDRIPKWGTETRVTHCQLGVNPSVPHCSHSHIRPEDDPVLQSQVVCAQDGGGWCKGSPFSTPQVCGSPVGNLGPGSSKCHRDTRHFQMILLQPIE